MIYNSPKNEQKHIVRNKLVKFSTTAPCWNALFIVLSSNPQLVGSISSLLFPKSLTTWAYNAAGPSLKSMSHGVKIKMYGNVTRNVQQLKRTETLTLPIWPVRICWNKFCRSVANSSQQCIPNVIYLLRIKLQNSVHSMVRKKKSARSACWKNCPTLWITWWTIIQVMNLHSYMEARKFRTKQGFQELLSVCSITARFLRNSKGKSLLKRVTDSGTDVTSKHGRA